MTETQLAAKIGRAMRSEGDVAQDGKAAQANGAPRGGGTALPVFYRRPRPLNATDHAMRSLHEATDFRFALGTNSVVVNGVEFPLAMRHYPIVFTVGEPRAALAVLGLADNENLFVGEAGSWSADCYVPAYVRRALPDDVFLEWRRRGWLHLVYCQLMSMANWSRLLDLEAKRRK